MLAETWLATLVFAVFGATAQTYTYERDYRSNLRLNNVRGLSYSYYKWIGSYYNGTTTLRIEPQNIKDERCDKFGARVSIEIKLGYSVLAIVKSNLFVPNQNAFTFGLRYWDGALHPDLRSDDTPLRSGQYINSVENLHTDYSRPNESPPPLWQLNPSYMGDSSYGFTGNRNATMGLQIYFNYTQSTCHSSPLWVVYAGGLLDPGRGGDGFEVSSYPAIKGRFDGKTASLEIRGVVAASERGTQAPSQITGPITISFEGQLDQPRSDELLPSFNNTPRWNETLGISKYLTEYTSDSTARTIGCRWWIARI